MLLDILNQNGYISVNKKIASILGLKVAVYVSVLLSVYSKATKKKDKLDADGYMTLNRNYVRSETTLRLEEQRICDAILSDMDIITISPEDSSKVIVNADILTGFLTELSQDELKALKKRAKDAAEAYKQDKTLNKNKNLFELRCSEIIYSESDYPDLYDSMTKWIKAIGDSFGYTIMSSELLKDFEDELNRYTDGYLDKAIEIIGIATTLTYKDVRWAIKEYEKRHQIFRGNVNAPRVTQQERATKEDLMKGDKF